MKRRSCDLSGCLTGQSSKICPSDLTHQNRYNEKVVEYSANGMMKRFQRRGLKSNAQVSDTLQAYGTNDAHKPAHAHVKGKGHEVRIGPNGKPLKGEKELSTQQKQIVDENKKEIRREINKVGKENKRIEENE